jgi:signal transduction histidine kinase
VTADNLKPLADLITYRRDELLTSWRREVRRLPGAQQLDAPTINDHIPQLLDDLAAALGAPESMALPGPSLADSPSEHGIQRWQAGFDITEVVAEYNILRDCLQDLAEQHGLGLQGEAGHIINRILDEAIGQAVKTFAAQQLFELQQRRAEHLAFVAHDLRTPLEAISLATSMLEHMIPAEARSTEIDQTFRSLRRNITRLTALVKNVLREEANLQVGETLKLVRRELDLWPLVEGLVQDMHPLAKDVGAEIHNLVPRDLVIFADARLLTQVFQNLLSNALKYAPKGAVVIGAREIDGGVECWVQDNGAGIPEDRLGKVFDKLESDPDPRRGGMGLGLAIVKQIVEAHGGQVSVESRVGQGSTFRFVIPASDAPAQPASSRPEAESGGSESRSS